MKDFSNYESDIFSCTYEGCTAVIYLKAESFKMTTNASYMHDMLECLNAIELDKNIKGIMTLHSSESEQMEVLQEFIQSVQKEAAYAQKERGVTRYGNSIKRITLAINEFSKPCVVGIRGQVPIDSFGFFLACDHRIAEENMNIEFPGLNVGVTPVGAVSFFMKRQLGHSKTLQILLDGKDISSHEARNLCLVDKVVSGDEGQLKAACQEKLDEYYKVPGMTLNLTKQLVRPKTHELEEYFEISSRLFWSSIIDN